MKKFYLPVLIITLVFLFNTNVAGAINTQFNESVVPQIVSSVDVLPSIQNFVSVLPSFDPNNTGIVTGRYVEGYVERDFVPNILNFLYDFGFSSYQPTSGAVTFGPVTAAATGFFQELVSLPVNNTFDVATATAATALHDDIVAAVDALPVGIVPNGFVISYPGHGVSEFNISTGVFDPIVRPDPSRTNAVDCFEACGGLSGVDLSCYAQCSSAGGTGGKI